MNGSALAGSFFLGLKRRLLDTLTESPDIRLTSHTNETNLLFAVDTFM